MEQVSLEIPGGSIARGGSAKILSRSATILLLMPLALLLAIGFVYPLLQLVKISLFTPEFGIESYRRILNEPLYLLVLLRTFMVAFCVMVLCLVGGYPVAFAMSRLKGRSAALVAACVLIPLWTSVLIRSYAWIVLLQRNGIINSALLDAGLVSEPLKLIYTETAVIVAMAHVLMPFMILPLFSTLRSIPKDLSHAALNLGAGPLVTFLRVTLPLSTPGVFAGCVMTFILAIGFYITPTLVGGPGSMMIATLIGQQTTVVLDWSFAAALSTVLLVITLILVVAFRKTISLNKGFNGVN
ncbi:ABC transporter permease [Ensifer sp. ENS07]|uniref:ABC transporter permease n=1 Tax=Ensifer sp. ENS07 TaxID=2769274 RepID=UPI00177E4204|nr:ABC transporter permease [Ensifer sp. ENS07]MBD9641704.1 ABC transporter permease [Ensifer sp. ENS07]